MAPPNSTLLWPLPSAYREHGLEEEHSPWSLFIALLFSLWTNKLFLWSGAPTSRGSSKVGKNSVSTEEVLFVILSHLKNLRHFVKRVTVEITSGICLPSLLGPHWMLQAGIPHPVIWAAMERDSTPSPGIDSFPHLPWPNNVRKSRTGRQKPGMCALIKSCPEQRGGQQNEYNST